MHSLFPFVLSEMECLSNGGTGLDEDPTRVVGKVLLREAFEVKKISEATTSKVDHFRISPTPADGKNHSQWHGFIKKLKKGQGMSLYTFHPSIPSLTTMKKVPKKRIRKSLPTLPPQIDGDLVPSCFETSWINFTLPELQKITDNFSPGTKYFQ